MFEERRVDEAKDRAIDAHAEASEITAIILKTRFLPGYVWRSGNPESADPTCGHSIRVVRARTVGFSTGHAEVTLAIRLKGSATMVMTSMSSQRISVSLVALFLIAWSGWSADRVIAFNRDVRPILSDKCFGCHGPDAAQKNIPLRLDSEAAAKAVVSGGSQARLLQRITSENRAVRMPPVYSGLNLSAAEIDTLRMWVEQGAKWERHWSLIVPQRPSLPNVKNRAWPRNAIDYFVLERLEREGLRPSAEASREALIRRVSLDLTGLPATPPEVDAFVQDKSANAYEKVVDRLLASPRYGERMAARWLDAARYADTNGYQYDGERVMWRWRD